MTRREREDNQMWLTLLAVSLIVAACLAWIAPVIDMLALNLKQDGGASTSASAFWRRVRDSNPRALAG